MPLFNIVMISSRYRTIFWFKEQSKNNHINLFKISRKNHLITTPTCAFISPFFRIYGIVTVLPKLCGMDRSIIPHWTILPRDFFPINTAPDNYQLVRTRARNLACAHLLVCGNSRQVAPWSSCIRFLSPSLAWNHPRCYHVFHRPPVSHRALISRYCP